MLSKKISKVFEIEEQKINTEMKYHGLLQPKNSKGMRLGDGDYTGEGVSPRHPVNNSRQTSNSSDITASSIKPLPLPEVVPVNKAQPSSSQYQDSPSTLYSSMSSTGSITEDVLLAKSIKSIKLQQSDLAKHMITFDRNDPSPKSSNEDSTGSIGEDECDCPETYDESEEGSEEIEISVKSALDMAMNVVKGLLLRELLDCALPDAMDALEGSGSASSRSQPSSAGSSTSSNVSLSNSGPNSIRAGKRVRANGRNSGDTDGDESEKDHDRPKKKPGKDPHDRPTHGRLKCPFFQRQPERYTKAACRGRGFADMAKLKDHIKRVHTQPLRCSRCWLEMRSEDAYSEHLQREEACTRKAEPQDDRIRPQVLKRLDFKKSPYMRARNVEEKWNMMFSALFPDDTDIPSPCKWY
jgi:hypothetical protein